MTQVILVSGWGHSAAFMQTYCGPFFESSLAYDLADLEDNYAERLADVLTGTSKPIVLCGWSIGAMIALETALLIPDKIEALVLFGGTARYCADDHSPFAVPSKEIKALRRSCRRAPTDTLNMFRDHCRTGEHEQSEFSSLTLETGLSYLADKDLRTCISAIKCPALVFHGTEDQVVPVDSGRELAALLPTSTLHELPKALHACFLDAPDEIRHNIDSFMTAL